MEINMKESGSFGMEKMLKTALPEYKLGEFVEGAKVTFLETEAAEETEETFDDEASKMDLEDDKMIDEKELIRRALMGDLETQKECTEKGIVLPCPFCGGDAELRHLSHETSFSEIIDVFCVTCKKCGCNPFEFSDYNLFYTSKGIQKAKLLKQKALEKWNTRPAPPIGRCEDCKWSYEPNEQDYIRIGSDAISYNDACVCNFLEPADIRHKNDFCSYFEPREE